MFGVINVYQKSINEIKEYHENYSQKPDHECFDLLVNYVSHKSKSIFSHSFPIKKFSIVGQHTTTSSKTSQIYIEFDSTQIKVIEKVFKNDSAEVDKDATLTSSKSRPAWASDYSSASDKRISFVLKFEKITEITEKVILPFAIKFED